MGLGRGVVVFFYQERCVFVRGVCARVSVSLVLAAHSGSGVLACVVGTVMGPAPRAPPAQSGKRRRK